MMSTPWPLVISMPFVKPRSRELKIWLSLMPYSFIKSHLSRCYSDKDFSTNMLGNLDHGLAKSWHRFSPVKRMEIGWMGIAPAAECMRTRSPSDRRAVSIKL